MKTIGNYILELYLSFMLVLILSIVTLSQMPCACSDTLYGTLDVAGWVATDFGTSPTNAWAGERFTGSSQNVVD